MPIFSRHWLGQDGRPDIERLRYQGPALAVEITARADFAAAEPAEIGASPRRHIGLALIDTGASFTSVDEAPLHALGLRPKAFTDVATPSSVRVERPVYACVLSFPGTPLPPIPFNEVVASNLAGFGVAALIGRDVLADCQLVYNGLEGFWTLAF